MTEERDGGQQVFGADVGTDVAGCGGGVDELVENGSQPFPEVAGKGVERRVA